jgi:hypothetical protein
MSETSPKECLCGCGDLASPGKQWVRGHDRKAESAVVLREYGSIAEFLTRHGYGPGRKRPISGEPWDAS